MSASDFKIAIVGSGPSGCYAAQFLNKSLPQASIYVFEQLPVPYGLLRYGIASDHQGSKNVVQQYDRVFKNQQVHFCGNVSVGKDISFDALKENFNVVILATGLEKNKKLNIPMDAESRVIGAGDILKSLNTHPDYISKAPYALGSSISIIGAGNVSMDIVRLLCAKEHHLAGSDIYDEYHHIVTAKQIQKIDVFSRSSAYETKFDLSMLKEIIALEHVNVHFSDDNDVFRALKDQPIADIDHSIQVNFHFKAKPVAVYKDEYQSLLKVERRSNAFQHDFYTDTVITAIGFENDERKGLGVQSDWAGDFVFPVGWLQSGGTGTVAANRKAVKTTVDQILEKMECSTEHIDLQQKFFTQDLQKLIEKSVSFEQWQKIDAFEKRFKPENRCRRKVTTKSAMLMIASSPESYIESQTNFNVA